MNTIMAGISYWIESTVVGLDYVTTLETKGKITFSFYVLKNKNLHVTNDKK